MTVTVVNATGTHTVADLLVALCVGEGSAAHPFLKEVAGDSRSLADAVHYLGMLHGRHPGVLDHAADRTTHPAARGWLAQSTEAFSAERAYLARLVAAAGPLPATVGQADCDAAVLGQHHALEMLARSDRAGCALGAAIALVLDWTAIRSLLDDAARRFSVDVTPAFFPPEQESRTLALACAHEAPLERAIAFGAQQLLAQHRGLWDLLATRQGVRQR